MKTWILLKQKLRKPKTKEAKTNVPKNLLQEELIALQNFSKNKDLIIQISEKGNSAVIVQRQDYLKKMNYILRDQKKFSKVILKEKLIDKVLKKLVEFKSMTEKTRKSLKLVGTRPSVMYGSCKVHKSR